MPIPHWEDSPAEWDSLTLGAWVMPGVWTVDFSVRREMDVKKAVSTDGARLKDKGYQPPQLTLIGRIYGREEWDALQKIMPSIHPRRKGASRKPFRITHPKTLLMGIENIFIHEIDAVDVTRGILTIELRAYEWTPQPKPVQKASETPEGPGGGNDAYRNPLEPPAALGRFPGQRGVRLDPTNPDDVGVVTFTTVEL